MTTERTFSAKQIASRIGTDAKTLRKFFRSAKSSYQGVGQGARYEFPESQLETIRADFAAWQKGKRYPAAAELKPRPAMVPDRKPLSTGESIRAKAIMARFPLVPGESVADRTKRVGAVLIAERIAAGKCGRCQDPFEDHWEHPEMQALRPRSAQGKKGCTRPGCWCTKLLDKVRES